MPGCSSKREGSSAPQAYWVAAASVSVSSGRRGGRNNKYNANRCIMMHDKAKRDARRALTRYEVIPVKGENIRESIPGVPCFWTDEPEVKCCGFDRLGVCGGRTDCVSGFVSSI